MNSFELSLHFSGMYIIEAKTEVEARGIAEEILQEKIPHFEEFLKVKLNRGKYTTDVLETLNEYEDGICDYDVYFSIYGTKIQQGADEEEAIDSFNEFVDKNQNTIELGIMNCGIIDMEGYVTDCKEHVA